MCSMCRGGKKVKLAQGTQLMASEREIVEEAYAGDIIGVFDPGIFSIGDTLHHSQKRRLLSQVFPPLRRSIFPASPKWTP